jgi:PPK2 family polyphosphate:nucleotide phosphotransferase
MTEEKMTMIDDKIIRAIRVEPGTKVNLKDYPTTWAVTPEIEKLGETEARERAARILDESREALEDAQELLYASDTYAVLAIFQGMDASGKDGVIKHVMSGVNPQGVQVFSFKQPSPEELDHTFLWRCQKVMPERGRIGIFNRSYYEEVLVVRVHQKLLDYQKVPPGPRDQSFWDARFEDINAQELHLVRNGTIVLKFFLHLSKAEQKRRFIARLDEPEKNWKFSAGDVEERQYWDQYQAAFEDLLSHTSTEWAPWYAIPADDKWAARTLVADIIASSIQALKLEYPEVSDAEQEENAAARRILESEKDD